MGVFGNTSLLGSANRLLGHLWDANTIGLWRFNELSSSDPALDEGGLYSMPVVNGPIILSPAGSIGGAREFTTESQRFTRTDNNPGILSQITAGDYSIEAWVRIDAKATDFRWFFTAGNGSLWGAFFGISPESHHPGSPATPGNYLTFGWNTNGPPSTLLIFCTSTVIVPMNQWVHVAAVRSGNTATLYLNGAATDAAFVNNFWGYNETYPRAAPSGPIPILTGADWFGFDPPSSPYCTFDDVRLSNIARTGAEVLASYNRGSHRSFAASVDSLRTGLVAYWTMDGDSNDSLGSYSGTDTAMSYSGAKINSGGVGNGTTSKIETVNIAELNGGGPRSISMWVKLGASTSGKAFFRMGTDANARTFGIFTNIRGVGTSEVYVSFYSCDIYSADSLLDSSFFHHVVVVHDGGTVTTSSCRIYVDGNLKSTTFVGSVTGPPATSSAVGRMFNDPTRFFDGTLDEVGLWNRGLTPNEIATVYAGGAGVRPPSLAPSNYPGKVKKQLPLGTTGPHGLAFDGTNMWSINYNGGGAGTADKINPTGESISATVSTSNGPVAIAYGGGYVWTSDNAGARISRIHVSTNAVTTIDPGKTNPYAIQYGDGYLWVGFQATDRLVSIDPSTLLVVTDVAAALSPANIRLTGGNVGWLSSGAEAKLQKFNTTTGVISNTYTLPSTNNYGMAWDGTNLWVSGASGKLSKVNVSDGSMVTYTLFGAGWLYDTYFDGASLWVCDVTNYFVHRLDLSGNILQTLCASKTPLSTWSDGTYVWVDSYDDNLVTKMYK
jgi:hypothetical protein